MALGVATNQAFLLQCLAHPVFAAGGATTAFIGEHQAELLGPLKKDGNPALHQRAAALAALLLHLSNDAQDPGHGLTHRLPMLQRFELDGVPSAGALAQQAPTAYTAQLDGGSAALAVVRHQVDAGGASGRSRVAIDGVADTAVWQRDGATLRFQFAGRPWTVHDHSRAPAARAAEGGGDGKLRASMNGRVVAVQVAVGDSVAAGQPMVTLEAMKMEHVHVAPVAGKVLALHVSVGDQVASKRVVAEVVVEA